MPKRTRYTISLLPSDVDIIKHLENVKKNTTLSMYVRKLIKDDLENSNQGLIDIEKVVEEVIQRIKQNDELQLVQIESKKVSITNAQRNIISSLF